MAVSGNFSETVGALTLSANSTIDFVEVSTYCHAASTKIDGGVVVHGVLCCNEEGATGGILEGLGAA